MQASLFVLLSGSLTFGVPLVLGVRELLMLKPGRGGWSGDKVPEIAPPPPPTGQDAPHKPLPACLIPALPAKPPVRVLETV